MYSPLVRRRVYHDDREDPDQICRHVNWSWCDGDIGMMTVFRPFSIIVFILVVREFLQNCFHESPMQLVLLGDGVWFPFFNTVCMEGHIFVFSFILQL